MPPMNITEDKPIKSYTFSEIEEICRQQGLPRFRADQLIGWIYKTGVTSYGEMTNLPAKMRDELGKRFPLHETELIDRQLSRDGTRKYVFRYFDGACVEAVGIPSRTRDEYDVPQHLSICFSTQVGCPMECVFCATGAEGFTRNLSAGEMIDQVRLVQEDFGVRASHVVSMGQGEPFMNYDATIEALGFLNDGKKGFGIGARHITISSCGLIPGIRRLSEDPRQFTFALSLHSARQDLRDTLMPRCTNTPLPSLKQALQAYVKATGRRVSLEYLMMKGINDSNEDLEALITFCSNLLCHINLIPLNAVEHSPYQPSSKNTLQRWMNTLSAAHKEVTIRDSRGSDIDGACGQLKNKLHE